MNTKRLTATVGLSLVFVAGIVLRWWILGTPQGALSADEAYTGLQAHRILDGDWPVVIEGQAYTAVFDSYVLAPVVWAFGSSILVIKWLTTVWWLVAAALVHRLVTVIADARTGWVAASLFWLSPGSMMLLTTRGYEGYGIGLVLVLTLALLVVSFATSVAEARVPSARRAGAIGFTAGLALYVHPMYAAVVVPLLLVPAWRERRCVRGWWIPLAMGGVVANLPFIVWNVRNDWASLDQVDDGGDGPLARLVDLFGEIATRTFGLRGFGGDWTYPTVVTVGLVLALVGPMIVGLVSLLKNSPSHRVIALPLILSWPIMMSFNNLADVDDGRYGIIVFPFATIAFAVGMRRVLGGARSIRWSPFIVMSWGVLLVVPWLADNAGSRHGNPNADTERAAALIMQRGFDRVEGSFWRVLPIEYVSDRSIRGAAAGEPFAIRVVDSHALVTGATDDRVAFVLEARDPQEDSLRLPREQYEVVEVGEIAVYLPKTESGR